MLYLLVTNKGTLIISPHVQLLNKLGEVLGAKLGPFKIEKLKDISKWIDFARVA